MHFVVKGGFILYTAYKLKAFPDMVHAGNGLLNDALSLRRSEAFGLSIDTDMVQLLLEHDASPNH